MDSSRRLVLVIATAVLSCGMALPQQTPRTVPKPTASGAPKPTASGAPKPTGSGATKPQTKSRSLSKTA